jgi:hypothetical protein
MRNYAPYHGLEKLWIGGGSTNSGVCLSQHPHPTVCVHWQLPLVLRGTRKESLYSDGVDICVKPAYIVNMKSYEQKTERVIVPMEQSLVKLIEDYRFKHRVPSRAEAIRDLLRAGLAAAGRHAEAHASERKG